MSEETNEKPNWQRLLITLGIVLFAVLVVGGTTWYVMEKSAKEVQTANEKSVAELQKQIDGLKNTKNVAEDNITNKVAEKNIETIDVQTVTNEDKSTGRFLSTQYADINNDSKKEAVVVFVFDGTGQYNDVFIVGLVDNEAKVLYSKKTLSGANVGFSNTNPQHLFVSWVDPNDAINSNKSNSEMVISKQMDVVWNGNLFAETIEKR